MRVKADRGLREAFQADDPAAGVAYIEGGYRPVAEAHLPILDWGLTRSDVTYDVVHVWQGRFFRLRDHLDRFFTAMATLRLDPGVAKDEVAEILERCVALSTLRDAYVEVLCTRGVPPSGVRDPRLAVNRLVAFAIPFVWIADERQRRIGLRAVVARTVRRIPPDAVDPTVKNFHWLDMVRGLFEAYDRGGETVILTDGVGSVTEGPGFNVFAILGGQVRTPREGVLLGITRDTVLKICADLGVAAYQGPLTMEELVSADEVFLTSTAGGVMPVGEIDGNPVGAGGVGPMTVEIQNLYWAWHGDPKWSTPVDYRLVSRAKD